MPESARPTMSSWKAALVRTSMPTVGSSMTRMSQSAASHLARLTFCWLPPESCPASCIGPEIRMPSWSRYRLTRSRSFLPRTSPALDSRRHTVTDTLRAIV